MKKYIILIGIISVLAYACNDADFIDVNPSSLTPEDALNQEGVGEEMVNAVYNGFLSYNAMSFPWIGMTSIASDNADKGGKSTGADKHILDGIVDISPANTASLTNVWQSHYDGIGRANQALKYIPGITTLEQSEIDILVGQVKFLRALFYFRLVNSFGGVPLVDHVLDVSNEEDKIIAKVRATKEEVYDFIIEDLTFAASSLPVKSEWGDADSGRATKGAAMGLLAKVNMYIASERGSMEHWQRVYDLSTELGGMGYALVTETFQHTTAGSPLVLKAVAWLESEENNTESIFEIQARGITVEASIGQYSNCQSAFGWQYCSPSLDLENAFEPGDLRLKSTIAKKNNNNFKYWDGRKIPNAKVAPRYNQKSFVSANQDLNSWNRSNFTNKNVRILRYADVLLMHAEAANELGLDATTSLNMVRNRAALGDTPYTSQDDLRMAIWKERRVELALEHDRWFNLGRQGRRGVVMRAHGKDYVDGKHDVYPIPVTQIELSGGLLIQNPGY